MALELNFKGMLSQIFQGYVEDDINNKILGAVNTIVPKINSDYSNMGDILTHLQETHDRFMDSYHGLEEKIYFENSGILESAGISWDEYNSMSRGERAAFSRKNNLLSPYKFSRELQNVGYNVDNLKEGKLSSYLNETDLRAYASNYASFTSSIKDGYRALLQVGQNLRGTDPDSFNYIVGFFKGQGLEHLLTLKESELDAAMDNLSFFGTRVIGKDDARFGFNSGINRNELYNYMRSMMGINENGLIRNGQMIFSEAELIEQFKFLKQSNIISFASGESITDNNPRILELLVSEGIVSKLMGENGVVGYRMDLENLAFMAGSDIMGEGHEESVKSVTGRGHNASFVDYSTVVRGLTMLRDPEAIRGLAHDIYENNYEISQNRSEFIEETSQELSDEYNEMAVEESGMELS